MNQPDIRNTKAWRLQSLSHNGVFMRFLVAAGVGLRGNQDQARAAGGGFGLSPAAEHRQNSKDRRICGEDANAYRGKDCEAENDGHHERNHDLEVLLSTGCAATAASVSGTSFVVSPWSLAKIPQFSANG